MDKRIVDEELNIKQYMQQNEKLYMKVNISTIQTKYESYDDDPDDGCQVPIKTYLNETFCINKRPSENDLKRIIKYLVKDLNLKVERWKFKFGERALREQHWQTLCKIIIGDDLEVYINICPKIINDVVLEF